MFSKNSLDNIKKEVNLTQYIESVSQCKSRHGYFRICPFCGGKDHFSVKNINGVDLYHSFSTKCPAEGGGDIITFMTEFEHLSFKEAKEKLFSLTGSNHEELKTNKKSNHVDKSHKDKKIEQDFSLVIEEAHSNVTKTDYYTTRGLTKKTVDKYKLGFLPNGLTSSQEGLLNIPINNAIGKDYRFIIPVLNTDSTCSFFIPRSDDSISSSSTKVHNLPGVPIKFLNYHYLEESSGKPKVIFICEGWADCLSLEDLGYKSISINGTSNYKKLLDTIKDNISNLKGTTFVLAGDNDLAGIGMNTKLYDGITNLGIQAFTFQIPEEYHDINDYFVKNRTGLSADIRKLLGPLTGNDFIYTYLPEFLNDLEEAENRVILTTGFSKLDTILGGGLYPGLYIIGGMSSLGKTTLTLQIAEYVAANNNDVLFFSLEMSKLEIVAKGLVREIYKTNKKSAIDTRSFLNGKFNKEVLKEVLPAYQETIGKHQAILEGNFDTDLKQIRRKIDNHIATLGTSPLVVIDYLQILKPPNAKMLDKQAVDLTVLELKRISRDYNIPIIAISSLNRSSYTGPINHQSFKESGGIEYSADVLIGMQLAGIDNISHLSEIEKNQQLNYKKSQDLREIELVILKQRNGVSYSKTNLLYYPTFNYFRDQA